LFPEYLKERIKFTVEYKNILFEGVYGKKNVLNADEIYDWCIKYSEKIKHYICNTTELLEKAANEGKKILFEAQLGALRDVYYGIYPYTSSSSVLSSFAYIGGGLHLRI